MRSNIYVDGFNLYYGAVRNTPYKWLNIALLSENLCPGININRIRYFTARISGVHDPDAPRRQAIFLRALKTIPNLSIHEGHFVHWPVDMPRYPLKYESTGRTRQLKKVKVYKTEEKGSDVNLAVYLLDDCFSDDFDEAIVISNDSDLAHAIELVVKKYGKLVRIVNPHPDIKISGDLIRAGTSYIRTINRKVLAASQFPPILTDAKGTFSKPSAW